MKESPQTLIITNRLPLSASISPQFASNRKECECTLSYPTAIYADLVAALDCDDGGRKQEQTIKR